MDMLAEWKAEHRAHHGGGPGPLRVESTDLATAIKQAERLEREYRAVLDDSFRGRTGTWDVLIARIPVMLAWSRVVDLHTVARAKLIPDPRSHPKYN